MKTIANAKHSKLLRVLPIIIDIAKPQSSKEANAVREAKRLVAYLSKKKG